VGSCRRRNRAVDIDLPRQLLAKEEVLGGELRARPHHRRGAPQDVTQDADDRREVKAWTASGHATASHGGSSYDTDRDIDTSEYDEGCSTCY